MRMSACLLAITLAFAACGNESGAKSVPPTRTAAAFLDQRLQVLEGSIAYRRCLTLPQTNGPKAGVLRRSQVCVRHPTLRGQVLARRGSSMAGYPLIDIWVS